MWQTRSSPKMKSKTKMTQKSVNLRNRKTFEEREGKKHIICNHIRAINYYPWWCHFIIIVQTSSIFPSRILFSYSSSLVIRKLCPHWNCFNSNYTTTYISDAFYSRTNRIEWHRNVCHYKHSLQFHLFLLSFLFVPLPPAVRVLMSICV